MAEKKVKQVTKLVIKAGKASPVPPIGSTLGPTGINLMQFCKEFNDKTATMSGNIPVIVTIYEDRTFSFVIKTPAVADLIKQTLNLEKGSGVPNKTKVGKLTKAQVYEIAAKKMPDLNCYSVEAAVKMVEGTCKSMGVSIVD
jgi:large subunit ribosomal protein L11